MLYGKGLGIAAGNNNAPQTGIGIILGWLKHCWLPLMRF
jgi:hypothetical protein